MNTKKIIGVYLLVIASIIILTGVSSASSNNIVSFNSIQVNGLETYSNATSNYYNVSIIAGSAIPITVAFTSTANYSESNVRLSVELQGVDGDVQNEVFVGDIEPGQTYVESLNLNVPSDLGSNIQDYTNLVVTVWNGDSSVSESQHTIQLMNQRQSYNVAVMSLNTVTSANAGDLVPVNVVLQNTGYNNLNDLYVIASIPSLNIERTAYFGDLSITSTNNDTTTGTIYLQIPYNTAPGTYQIQAEVKNNYIDTTAGTSVSIANQFQSNVIADNPNLTSNVGQSVTYNLEIVNPTTNINLYNIIPENVSGVTISTDSVVTVPAGSSRTITVTANSVSSGYHDFTVEAYSAGQLTGSVDLALDTQSGVSSPVVILTIILAVIFIALLVTLVILVVKKPEAEKSSSKKQKEEFGESYY